MAIRYLWNTSCAFASKSVIHVAISQLPSRLSLHTCRRRQSGHQLQVHLLCWLSISSLWQLAVPPVDSAVVSTSSSLTHSSERSLDRSPCSSAGSLARVSVDLLIAEAEAWVAVEVVARLDSAAACVPSSAACVAPSAAASPAACVPSPAACVPSPAAVAPWLLGSPCSCQCASSNTLCRSEGNRRSDLCLDISI